MLRRAGAATALLAAAALTLPPPATAEEPTCVAVVVDYREAAPSQSPHTWCAKGPAGRTGAEILVARANALGRPRPTFRSDGLLCTLDGFPSYGCDKVKENRYWAYHYRKAGSTAWQYSDKGPADTGFGSGRRPAHEEFDGWVWMDGGDKGSRTPPDVAYATVCPPAPKPTTAAPKPTTASPVPLPTATTPRSRPTTTQPAAVRATPTRTASSTPSPPPTEADTVAFTAEPDSGFPWGVVGGLGLAAGLGGAALLRKRRA